MADSADSGTPPAPPPLDPSSRAAFPDPAGPPPARPPPTPEEPSLWDRARAAPITFALAAINIAVLFYAERGVGSTTDTGTLIRYGAAEAWHVWEGDYWRVATCMFLHVGWIHLAWNTYASIGWCTAIERVLGKRRFLLIYLLSGVGAGCASIIGAMLWGPKVSAGASGAMFGIIGATLALRRRQLGTLKAFIADRGIRSTFVQLAIWTAIGLTLLHMDNTAHFGGLVVGFALTTVLTAAAPWRGGLVFGVAFASLFMVAAKPWWPLRTDLAEIVVDYADGYFSGSVPAAGKKTKPWPHDPAHGMRLLQEGCRRGVASACDAASAREPSAPP